MGVLRMGYAHVRVTDLAEAKKHYTYTLGMKVTAEDGNKVYLKGWDEWDHHSVVIEEGGVGVVKFGFKVEKLEDLARFEKQGQAFGDCIVERMSKGDNLEVGDGVRFTTPGEHVIEVYHDMSSVGNEVGFHNPEAWPRHQEGVAVPAIDHALVVCQDPTLSESFFREVLDFYPTERVQPELESKECMATWLSAGQKIHDIAILGGPVQGKLHHFAFQLEDWSAVLKAADIFSMDDVSIDIGPTRHGITRGETIYFFDPSGNRNEVFAGGYRAYPDRPCVVWTPDQLGKGIFYHDRKLNEAFTSVWT